MPARQQACDRHSSKEKRKPKSQKLPMDPKGEVRQRAILMTPIKNIKTVSIPCWIWVTMIQTQSQASLQVSIWLLGHPCTTVRLYPKHRYRVILWAHNLHSEGRGSGTIPASERADPCKQANKLHQLQFTWYLLPKASPPLHPPCLVIAMPCDAISICVRS